MLACRLQTSHFVERLVSAITAEQFSKFRLYVISKGLVLSVEQELKSITKHAFTILSVLFISI